MRLLLLLAMMAIFNVVHANERRVPVVLDASPADPVGRQIAFVLQKRIDASSLFQPANRSLMHVKVIFDSLDEFSNRSGDASVMSIVMIVVRPGEMPFYLANRLGYCEKNNVDECATMLFAAIENTAKVLNATVPDPSAKRGAL